VISALSTQGKVSELTSATMVTLNNQPAPVNVGRQVSYLASSSTTVTASAGSTTSLQPGQVQTGFSMVVLPHIIDGKELLLQSSINISSLLKLATITSGASTIQSPDVSTSNFIQRVKLNSGDLLVMAGFDQDNLSAVSNGVGEATNTLFGSRATSGTRKLLVVIVQPTVSI
jgi:type IVB pilus formation R64 PilN family outer membrane protein